MSAFWFSPTRITQKPISMVAMLNKVESLERQAIIAALLRLCDLSRMENLKLGDTVRLKSGGPVMTLGPQMDLGGYQCSWFSGDKLERGTFYLEQLEKAEPEKGWTGEDLSGLVK
jgi:uncharacterized protein YodC (DUF2158 family)